MTHVHGVVLLAADGVEDHQIAVGVILHNGALTGGAGAVEHPRAHGGAVVGAGVHAAVAAQILEILGDLGQALTVLIALQRSLGSSGGSVLGGGGLLLRGLDGVAVGVGGGGGAALEVDILIGGHIEGGGMLLIVRLQLVDGVGQALLVVLHIVGGDLIGGQQLLEQAGRHALPVGQLQVRLEGVALGLEGLLQAADGLLHLGLYRVIGAHAVGLGLLDDHGAEGQLLDSVLLQELIPGDVALVGDLQQHFGGVVHDLVGQGLGVIQTVVAGLCDVVRQTAVVVVVHLCHGVILTVDGNGVGVAVQDTGLHHQQQSGHHHENHGDGTVQTVGLAQLGLLLRLTDGLGVLDALAGQILAVLLFS